MKHWISGTCLLLSVTLLIITCNSSDTSEKKPDTATEIKPAVTNFKDLEKKVAEYPDSASLRVQLALAYENNGNLDQALNEIDNLLMIDSLNSVLYNRKAQLYLKKTDTAAAISTLQYSFGINPEQVDILLELGFLYADQKKKQALVIADHFLLVSKDSHILTQARYLKGIFYSNVGEKEKAIQLFDECIINDYTFIDAYLEKGILLYDQKKYSEALAVFEKARTIANTNADAYYWTGKSYEALNKKQEAIEFYQKALGLDDSIIEASEGLKRLTD